MNIIFMRPLYEADIQCACIINVYIAPGQGETTLGDSFFFLMEAGRSLVTLITGYMFQKIALPSDFMHFFMILYMYIASTGADNPFAKILMSTEMPHHLNLILYTSFHDLINVYSPGAGAGNPQGTKF